MAMIDTCLNSRIMFEEAMEQHAMSLSSKTFLENHFHALQDDAAACSFRSFISSFEDHTGQRALAERILDDSIPPTSVHLLDQGMPAAVTEAAALRERVMCNRILALCQGAITGGKPRKRIVAVVGAAHVRPLRELLLAAGSK